MNRNETARASWTRRLWILVGACVGLLAACGGGVGTGGTGAFASGPVSGFGSIIVSDVHFDESLARIEDDEGMGRDRADLHLGTAVEVESDAIRNDAAVASRVRIVSERIGRVDAVAANLLTVNGLPVRVNGGTVFDDAFPGGVAGVAVGTMVEVHGFATNTPGEVLATRVEPRANPATFKFRANISALDAQTFRIGSETFVYPPQVNGRNELAEGAFLRVWVNLQRDTLGRWVVSSIARGAPAPADNLEVKTVGLITLFVSNANLQVGPWLVNAAGAAIHNGPLAAGQRVKVEGRMQAGVLVASTVRVLGPPGGDELQMRGVIASVDPGTQTFLLNGRRERVSYAGSTVVFENGTAASLGSGRRITAYGRLSADGTQLDATRIRIEN